jgi:hypothetical protein
MTSPRALLRSQGLLPLTAVPKFTSLVEAVAGEPVRGSWWGHPAGKKIFAIASELEDSNEVLVTKLLANKVTFVDRALFAPLYRIVSDRGWRARASEKLSAEAHELIAAVGRKSLRADEVETTKTARKQVEESLLVRVYQQHTERGAHVTIYENWSAWAPAAVKEEAKALDFTEAVAIFKKAARGVRTPLDSAGPVTKTRK